ncbi:MAG: polysaccharide biosynthesis tyrosine autokinase [Chloroflexota bacterium]|nr:polysaccharide biosynthesis tyrosine autokinase [Chloroflexota bacterium]
MTDRPKADLVVAQAKSSRSLADRTGPGPMADPMLTFAQATDPEADSLSLQQLVLAFRRNKWLVLGIVAASLAAAAVYTRLADPVYRSSATIRIDDKDASSSLLTGIAAVPGMTSSKIPTEIEVLRSRQLAENVAKQLQLSVQVVEPATARRLLRAVEMPPQISPATIVLTRGAGGRYAIRQEGDGPAVALPAAVQPGTPFSVGRSTLVFDPPATGLPPDQVTFRLASLRNAADALRKKLTVSKPNREAQIVNVAYESNDPFLAAAVPNLILDEFMRYKAQTNKTEATSTVDFLRQQVASYEGQLKVAESSLGAYREEAQVVSIGDEAQAQVKRMADLQAERDQLMAERQSLAAILGKNPAQGSAARDIAAFPSFITNKGMQDILQSMIQLENERSQLLLRRNPENADVVALSERINELDNQLAQMARAYLAGVDSKLASVNAGIRAFGKQIETIPAREIAFARLSRDQKLLGDISTLLQTRLKEAEIKEAVQPRDVRVIDRALMPERPASPKPAINMLLGLFGGLFLAFVAATIRQMMDNKVRTREDVQAATGGVPILGAIPRLSDVAQSRKIRAVSSTDFTATAPPAAGPGSALIARASSRDVSSEAYRALRTNITFASVDHSNQVIVLTSALAGDGKSTTASNLAVTLAQQGVRTLLVDADLRKGVLYKLFDVDQEPGLTQILVGQASVASSLQVIPLGEDGESLHLLTSGRLPPNPAELLGSERMRSLIEELRQQFDMIVFDTPPLTMVTDAAVLGTLADSTILVARAGATDKRALHHAAAQLYHLRVNVSGTIVNDFDSKQSGYGYEYGYGYAAGYGHPYEPSN